MAGAREFLFSLTPGRELAALQAVIETIDAGLGERSDSTADLAALLQDDDLDRPLLEPHDPVLVDKILEAIIEMLADDDSIPALISTLDIRPDRDLAATYLGWFGPRAAQALPDLVDLASGSSGTAGPANQAIQRIGNAENVLMQALRASVVDDDEGSFWQLSDLMIRMGYESAPGFTDLLYQAAQSADTAMKSAVAIAISKLQPDIKKQFAAILRKFMADPDREVQRNAREAL